MDGRALLNLVDQMQRDRNIPREVIFNGIESAILLAAQKHYGLNEELIVTIDRNNGTLIARKGNDPIDPVILGRIAAQAAKQLMIQKFREAECQAVFDEYAAKKGDLVKGSIQRFEHGTATVALGTGKSEAILPRSEQIPGETHHVGDRIDAVILDVKKNGHRVKIILSRTHPDFVRQLFEKEIPEIADRTIEIKAIAREAGYRTKVAVSSIDMKVDCVGACVGVRGSRIKNIVDALGGERIDIVRWNDALQVLIPNALQPAQIEEVMLYTRLGRAIVLVQEDQLSLAIGRRGQNVRLGSKLVGWDVEIMTVDELNQSIERAEHWFSDVPGMTAEAMEALIEEGFLSYDDLTFVEASELSEVTGLPEEVTEEIIEVAEARAEELGDEGRTSRGNVASGDSEGRGRASASTRAANLLGGEATAAPVSASSEAKQAFENLFGAGQESPADFSHDDSPDSPVESESVEEVDRSTEEVVEEREVSAEEQGLDELSSEEPSADELSSEEPSADEPSPEQSVETSESPGESLEAPDTTEADSEQVSAGGS